MFHELSKITLQLTVLLTILDNTILDEIMVTHLLVTRNREGEGSKRPIGIFGMFNIYIL